MRGLFLALLLLPTVAAAETEPVLPVRVDASTLRVDGDRLVLHVDHPDAARLNLGACRILGEDRRVRDCVVRRGDRTEIVLPREALALFADRTRRAVTLRVGLDGVEGPARLLLRAPRVEVRRVLARPDATGGSPQIVLGADRVACAPLIGAATTANQLAVTDSFTRANAEPADGYQRTAAVWAADSAEGCQPPRLDWTLLFVDVYAPVALNTLALMPPGDVVGPRVALGWRPGRPERLDVHLFAPLLAAHPSLRQSACLTVPGADVKPETTCAPRCTDRVCTWRLEVPQDWRTDQGVPRPLLRRVRLTFSTPAGPLEPAEPWYLAETGERLGPRHLSLGEVSDWIVEPGPDDVIDAQGFLRTRVVVAQPDPERSSPTLQGVLPHPVARLLDTVAGTCEAQDGTTSRPACGRILQPAEVAGGTRLELDLEARFGAEPLRSYLRRDASLVQRAPLAADLRLWRLDGDRPLALDRHVHLAVTARQCAYAVEQLTRAHAGMRDGLVLYRVVAAPRQADGAPGDWRCPPPHWRVALDPPRDGVSVEDRLTVLAPGDGDHHLVGLHVRRVAADVGGEAPLRLQSLDGVEVLLRTDAPLPSLTFDAPPAFSALGVDAWLPAPSGDATAGEWAALADVPDLAAGRVNRLHFDVDAPELWRLRPRGQQYALCAPSATPATCDRCRDCGLDEAGRLAVEPAGVAREPLVFEARLCGAAARLKRAEVRLEAHERDLNLCAGTLDVATGRRAAPYRLAMNLPDRVCLRCGGAALYSDRGPKAVTDAELRDCELRVRLWSSEADACDDALGDEAFGDPEAEDAWRRFMRYHGDQTFAIELQTEAKDGYRPLPDPPGTRPSTLALFADRLPARQNIRWRVTRDGRLVVPVDLAQGGRIDVPQFGTVRLVVRHADPGAYARGARSFPRAAFGAVARKVPVPRGWIGASGVGPRLYLTFVAQPTVQRVPNSGLQASISSAYARVEQPAFGLGAVLVLEGYDFDAGEPWLPVNPQLNVGFLTPLRYDEVEVDDLRVSGVVGLGLRLPPATDAGPQSLAESYLSGAVWAEVTWDRQGELLVSLLFGFGVNITTLFEAMGLE